MERDTAFARTAGHRLLKKNTGQRVSDDAAQALVEALEDIGADIARKAQDFSRHADRKTIQKQDVKQAVRQTKR